MTLSRRALVAGLIGTAGGCTPANLLNATVPREGFKRTEDIAYGPLQRHKLDLYQPDKPRADGKTVIFFFGGAWDHGSRGEYVFLGQALAAQGTTVIIPSYGLFPEVRFPTFLEDAALAVRWSADRTGTGKLYVLGHSSGAHIAVMLAANTPYLAAAGVDRRKLPCVIGLSGPYDFPRPTQRLQDIFGGADRPETQPINFAKAPLPPVLLIHGAVDPKVEVGNSERLAAAWRAAGASVELKIYPGVNHTDVVSSFSELLRARAPTLADVTAYIDAH